MKVWSKRVIWFFGMYLLSTVDELAYFYIHKEHIAIEISYFYLALIVLPLFIFKEDKK